MMSAIAAKRTFAVLSILVLLVLGRARVTDVKNRTSGVTPPACGRATPRQTPLGTNEGEPDVRDFPWHANIYEEKNHTGETKKDYRCGATIIRANLLVTAARCVAIWYLRIVTDPKNLFVMTGNVHRDWDSPHNTAESVRKSAVKNIYVHCENSGRTQRWPANDIALIELEEPLPFSETLSPACLDVAGYSEQLLVPGAYGEMAEFGGPGSSDILQTPTLPYIPRNQCIREAASHSEQNLDMFTNDKFCAGYANGTSAPIFGAGGGLVFRKDDAWYLMGIHTSTLFYDDATGSYDDYAEDDPPVKRLNNSLYTRMSDFTEWIQKIISLLQHNESVPPCERKSNRNRKRPETSRNEDDEDEEDMLNNDAL